MLKSVLCREGGERLGADGSNDKFVGVGLVEFGDSSAHLVLTLHGDQYALCTGDTAAAGEAVVERDLCGFELGPLTRSAVGSAQRRGGWCG